MGHVSRCSRPSRPGEPLIRDAGQGCRRRLWPRTRKDAQLRCSAASIARTVASSPDPLPRARCVPRQARARARGAGTARTEAVFVAVQHTGARPEGYFRSLGGGRPLRLGAMKSRRGNLPGGFNASRQGRPPRCQGLDRSDSPRLRQQLTESRRSVRGGRAEHRCVAWMAAVGTIRCNAHSLALSTGASLSPAGC